MILNILTKGGKDLTRLLLCSVGSLQFEGSYTVTNLEAPFFNFTVSVENTFFEQYIGINVAKR